MNTECYAQDNWRMKRNFTVDAGVRFYCLTPTQSQGDKVAAFEPDLCGPRQRRRYSTCRSLVR